MTMSIWCPKCKYKTVLKRFYDDHCPQCRTVVGVREALTKDPYRPEVGAKMGIKHRKAKKFEFDQRGGSSEENEIGSGALKSRPIDPVFGINGRI
jgi:hypothetical protein